MHELAGLIREFPMGSFFIITGAIWALERMVVSAFSRNRPIVNCQCDCCGGSDNDDEDEEEE